MSHFPVVWLKFTSKCPIIKIFFNFHGVAILASAFMVLEQGALVIYDGIKNFLTCLEWGNELGGGEELLH